MSLSGRWNKVAEEVNSIKNDLHFQLEKLEWMVITFTLMGKIGDGAALVGMIKN